MADQIAMPAPAPAADRRWADLPSFIALVSFVADCAAGGSAAAVLGHLLVAVVGLAGAFTTAAWWQRADQHR
ncbi:hypothetical protein [Planobispora longispora]|uniref:Uncharacterized protein n=1 Tax=Planobispora longispora TaxID=28887 RepID=A0A8J3RHU8_9ACTN|nr:hypothetical protein [Planobispora longispora]BFE77543.1 hypothetical protein GCM10020093_001440 [Planobispora longispora]GIH73944.1 hypothetical protein Plo01_03730 [Planobispora longispora]